MTKEEKNRAIAKFCNALRDPPNWHGAYACPDEMCVALDYSRDHNAMREAEEFLCRAHIYTFNDYLKNLWAQMEPVRTLARAFEHFDYRELREMILAPLDKRVDAFLITVGEMK